MNTTGGFDDVVCWLSEIVHVDVYTDSHRVFVSYRARNLTVGRSSCCLLPIMKHDCLVEKL